MYHYRLVAVHHVVDGDTIDAVISLGFGLQATIRIRVAGIDTPELYGVEASAAGADARDFAANWLDGRQVNVRTFKGATNTVGIGDGAFGRWLGSFEDAETGEKLVDALREAGFADS